MRTRTIFYDILVGIPGGLLIFMSMLMINAVLSLVLPTSGWEMLVILCVTSLVVGMLTRLMRPVHWLGTVLAAGVIAALIILSLWLSSRSGTDTGLVFGPAGMFVTVGFSLIGAWSLSRLRRPKK